MVLTEETFGAATVWGGNDNPVQRTTCFAPESRSDATLGDLLKQLGKVDQRPALLCVAV